MSGSEETPVTSGTTGTTPPGSEIPGPTQPETNGATGIIPDTTPGGNDPVVTQVPLARETVVTTGNVNPVTVPIPGSTVTTPGSAAPAVKAPPPSLTSATPNNGNQVSQPSNTQSAGQAASSSTQSSLAPEQVQTLKSDMMNDLLDALKQMGFHNSQPTGAASAPQQPSDNSTNQSWQQRNWNSNSTWDWNTGWGRNSSEQWEKPQHLQARIPSWDGTEENLKNMNTRFNS